MREISSVLALVVRPLLIGSPVHDESMRDDHLVQIVLIMSGDAEKVQIVAFLIVSDLEEEEGEAISSTLRKHGWH